MRVLSHELLRWRGGRRAAALQGASRSLCRRNDRTTTPTGRTWRRRSRRRASERSARARRRCLAKARAGAASPPTSPPAAFVGAVETEVAALLARSSSRAAPPTATAVTRSPRQVSAGAARLERLANSARAGATSRRCARRRRARRPPTSCAAPAGRAAEDSKGELHDDRRVRNAAERGRAQRRRSGALRARRGGRRRPKPRVRGTAERQRSVDGAPSDADIQQRRLRGDAHAQTYGVASIACRYLTRVDARASRCSRAKTPPAAHIRRRHRADQVRRAASILLPKARNYALLPLEGGVVHEQSTLLDRDGPPGGTRRRDKQVRGKFGELGHVPSSYAQRGARRRPPRRRPRRLALGCDRGARGRRRPRR